MTQEDYKHPITPPLKLVQQWASKSYGSSFDIATLAAQWGSDQELEACCEEMKSIPSPLGIPFGEMASNALRAARRPNPPSLKEQALELAKPAGTQGAYVTFGPEELGLIRRALEQLPDAQ